MTKCSLTFGHGFGTSGTLFQAMQGNRVIAKFETDNYDDGMATLCERLLEQRDALLAAAKAMLDKWQEIHSHPSYNAVFTSAWAHGCKYTGPSIDEERVQLEAALAACGEGGGNG